MRSLANMLVGSICSIVVFGGAPARGQYAVDGLSLGAHVRFESAAYREYQCVPSDQFSGFTLCRRRRAEKESRGAYTSTNTILHAADGTAVYINRYLEPAFFAAGEANADIDRLSRKFGPPRSLPMPRQAEGLNGLMVSWGAISLEPLDRISISDLAAGRDVRVGFMIDYIGNFRRSAELGLPIYRLRGGAGYVWTASWGENGRGTLRFLTTDASAYSPENPNAQSERERGPADQAAVDNAAARELLAERAEAERSAAEKAATDNSAAGKAAAEGTIAQKTTSEGVGVMANAAADQAPRETELELSKKRELRQRGIEYAWSSDTIWTITHRRNEMTDRTDDMVKSMQATEQGVVVEVVGYCENGAVAFSGMITGNGSSGSTLLARRAMGNGNPGYGVAALYHVNDDNAYNAVIPQLELPNKYQLAVFENSAGKPGKSGSNLRAPISASGAKISLAPFDTWRVMVELKAATGSIVVKIPMLDDNVQELLQKCN